MHGDRSSVLREQPAFDVPAMSAGKDEGQRFHEDREKIVRGAIEGHGGPSSHPGKAASTEPMRVSHPEFRATVTVGELTVTGVLPGTSRQTHAAELPEGSIAIAGDVQHLSCDDALQLVDALMLVVLRLDGATEERHSATTPANCDRED
jgi:hypothetical protein